MSAPKVRKHLSADALLGMLRSGFADIADHRWGDIDISRELLVQEADDPASIESTRTDFFLEGPSG